MGYEEVRLCKRPIFFFFGSNNSSWFVLVLVLVLLIRFGVWCMSSFFFFVE